MQDLCQKVWENPKFQRARRLLEESWIRSDLDMLSVPLESSGEHTRLLQAAAILACSVEAEHRMVAFRTAAALYELFGAASAPFEQGLRVVLSRLGNHPSIETRREIADALTSLPLALVSEELAASEARRIVVANRSFVATHFQKELWSLLIAGHRVALCAPTSAGKTFLLRQFLISRFSGVLPTIAVVLVPTRALITQVSRDIEAEFASSGVRALVVTVPPEPEDAVPERAVFVLTQERLQILLSTKSAFAPQIMIVDEAQSIGDGARGILLQWVIDEVISRTKKIQIVFASPIVSNLSVFGRLFGLTDVVELETAEPTVIQTFLKVEVESARKGKLVISTVGDGSRASVEIGRIAIGQTVASRGDKLANIAAALGKGGVNIVYANGPAEAESIAIKLAELLEEEEQPTPGRIALSQLAAEAVHEEYALVETVKRGVAFHYSNIPTELRRSVELAVKAGEIQFLVCTSTLLQGVNLPARNIFIFAPEKGRGRPLQPTDFWNLAGRAGRLREEFQGNIYLIDYDDWDSQPLEGARAAPIVPAMETAVVDSHAALLQMVGDADSSAKSDTVLETAFVRLYSDFKSGGFSQTLRRLNVSPDSDEGVALSSALEFADEEISLPADIVARTPNISAHRQQKLYEYMRRGCDGGQRGARELIPRHPREKTAFDSYASILSACHRYLLGRDVDRGLHRFHALMALWWMQGQSLPRLVKNQIERNSSKSLQANIRQTLELVETEIRYQCVRLFGCYSGLLIFALNESGFSDLVESVPSMQLYLEMGASDKTMISFMVLGLSRVVAMRLNEIASRKDMDAAAALAWLQTRPLGLRGLSPLMLSEVEQLLALNPS